MLAIDQIPAQLVEIKPYIPKSFTEQAYLSSFYLKYLYPSNCVESRINAKNADSILELLKNHKISPLTNLEKKSTLHKCLKPVRALARMAFTSFVVFPIVSTTGTIYHGAGAAYHFTAYAIEKNNGNMEGQNLHWEKTKHFADAFFVDFTAFIVTGTTTILGAFTVTIATYTVLNVSALKAFDLLACTVCSIGYGFLYGYATGGFYPDQTISDIVSYDNRRTSMYLSLALRNNLGLVDENGDLLPFLEEDLVYARREYGDFQRYNIYFNEAPGDDKYLALIHSAEIELIELIKQANQLQIPKIPYNYPFDGKLEANYLENYLKEMPQGVLDADKMKKVIAKIRFTQRKIDTLRELHRTAREMSVNGGLGIQILKCIGNQSLWSWNQPEVYTQAQEYWLAFHSINPINVRHQKPIDNELLKCQIDPLNPEEQTRPEEDNLYEQFLYDVRTAKWEVENNQNTTKKIYEFFGLTNDYTKSQLKSKYFKISRAVHPDKHGNSIESLQLFQFVTNVNTLLEEKLEIRANR